MRGTWSRAPRDAVLHRGTDDDRQILAGEAVVSFTAAGL
jgi:hypothetical protein